MATGCEDFLTADIEKDCDNKPKGGIEVNVVLINKEDIDYANSTLDGTNDLLLTSLTLLSGKTGYFVEGVKQAQGANFELVVKEESYNYYKQMYSGVVLNPSVANKKALSEILSGGDFVVVIDKKWKGAGQLDAFEVLGFDSGLTASTAVWNTKEVDGIIKFELANADGYEEPKLPLTLLETDYATTKTAFDNKFATV